MLRALILDLGDSRLLDRSVAAVVEAHLAYSVASPQAVAPGLSWSAGIDTADRSDQWLLLGAGEGPPSRQVMDLVNANARVAVRGRLGAEVVSHPFGLSADRRWSPADLQTGWRLRPRDSAKLQWHELPWLGNGVPRLSAELRKWLESAVHVRELERGATGATPTEALQDAVYLAWARHYEAALARALPVLNDLTLSQAMRAEACRVVLGAAAAAGRSQDAVVGLTQWWKFERHETAREWAELLAALAPSWLPHIRPLLGQTDLIPAVSAATTEWEQLAAVAHRELAVDEGRQKIESFLNVLRLPGREMTGQEALALCGAWSASLWPHERLLEIWPEQALPILQTIVENGPPGSLTASWDDLARAWIDRYGFSPALSELVLRVSAVLPLESVVDWEDRFRRAGIQSSPLIARSQSEQCSAAEQLIAASIAVQVGLAAEGSAAIALAVRGLQPEDVSQVLLTVDEVGPLALPALVGAMTSEDLLRQPLANCLAELGQQELVAELGLPPGVPDD